MEVDFSSESGSEGDFLDSDAEENLNDHQLLQKVNKLEEHLPFTEEIQQNRQVILQNLKTNALKAVLEQGDSLNNWTIVFDHYLSAFGCAFTKDEHIIFVKICLQALDSIKDNIPVSQNLLRLTTRLLTKTYLLSRQDIIIDWRLIYRLFERTIYSPHNTAKTLSFGYSFETELRKLLHNARVYFSVEATAEILSEWRQYLCHYSTKFYKAVDVLSDFLPTLFYPEEHQYGYQLWFQEFMDLWIALQENGKNHQVHNHFVKLFSRLAKDAKGFIDWNPYLPIIFERFKGLLRVDSYIYGNNKNIKMYIQWIIYSIFDTSNTLDYLQQFFRLRSVHFFISKEESDSQFQQVVNAALKAFTNRIGSERYKRNWFNLAQPTTSYLNSRLVNEFAQIMVTTVEKIGFKDFDLVNLYNLCNISAPILSGQVVEKLDLAYEQVCERKRLTAALQMFSMSLFPILTNDLIAAQYRPNVLPILTSLASNINTYDKNLGYLQLFSIRAILVLGLPLVDCSDLAEALDGSVEVEDAAKQLLLDTRQLDEFAHEFLRACFTLIESNNEDLLKMSKSHFSVKMLLYESLLYVLTNSSPAITKATLDKLFNYATSHIIENEKAAAVMARLIQAAFAFNAQYSMERFFSVVVDNTLATIGNKTKIADICKTELAYNLKLLDICYLVDDGKVLLAQEAKIVQVLEAIMKIQFEDTFGSMKNWNLLGSLFSSLLEVRLISRVLPTSKDDIQQLINWPKTYALKDLPLEWHVPEGDEIAFAKRLFTKFIEPEISRLDSWANSKLEMSKDQLEQSLNIVYNFASLKCFPSFAGGEGGDCSSYLEKDICATNMFPGSTIRDDLMVLMGGVLKRLLTTTDISALLNLVLGSIISLSIPYDFVPSFLSHITEPYDFRKLCHPLDNDTFFIPTVQFARMRAYHRKLTNSLKALREMKYTSGHRAAVEQLFTLATCPYESVRKSASWSLMKLLRIFPQSAELIVPQMLIHLQNSDQKSSFEGALTLLVGSFVDSMLILPSHSSVFQLWPQLLKTNFEAVPKIAQAIDYEKFSIISLVYVTIPIKRSLLTSDFSSLFESAQLANFALPTNEEMEAIESGINDWNEKSQSHYNDLIQQICVTLTEQKLQFRMQTLGTFLLNLLIRHDQLPPKNMMLYFLDALIHDSIHVRRTAVMGLKKILFLNRAPKEKVQVRYKAGDFQVDVYASEEVYNNTQFHDKVHMGYFEGEYTTKKLSKVPVTSNGFIAEKFKDKQYLERLFELFSVENATTIDFDFVKIWKYLYQSFNLFNDDLVFPHIEKLLEVDKHSHDKLAIEVMIGITEALPVLNYKDALKVVQFLSAISMKHLPKFNSESAKLWSTFVSKIFRDRDMRRNKFLLKQLSDSAFHNATLSPFYQTSFLQFLKVGYTYNFKYPEINQEIISKLEENLSHSYQNVRIEIAHFLGILFPDKVKVQQIGIQENSRLVFVQRVVSKFEKMLPLFSAQKSGSNLTAIKSEIFNQDSVEGKELLNLIETVSTWIICSLDSSKLINPADFIALFPYLCSVQLAQSNNSQVQSNVKRAIELMGKINYTEAEVDVILQMVEKVASNWNWHCRNQVPFFLQHLLYTNIFVLSRNDHSIDRLVSILNNLMEDEVVEVRESASITLSSLLIWNVVQGSKLTRLVEQYKSKSSREVVNADDLLLKHSGVLGLCAFLYACPDDLPAPLPDILLFLTKHLSDPQPIPKSITKAFNSFKRFHLPNWVVYKRQFTSDQLNELNNIFISPSYYA